MCVCVCVLHGQCDDDAWCVVGGVVVVCVCNSKVAKVVLKLVISSFFYC
jgi:hypothetical protein